MPQLYGKQIKDTSIAGAKLANGAVDTAQLAADAVDETILDLSKTYDLDGGGGDVKVADTPATAKSAVNKGYVDAVAAGLTWKQSARCATTAPLTLATDLENGDTLDGETLATGDRVLVKNQSTGSENGIYVVKATGAPDRASDYAAGAHAAGTAVFIEEGDTNQDTAWVCTNDDPNDVIGTDALVFSQFSGAATYTWGNGLNSTGSTIYVGDVNKGVQANADDLQVDASEIAGAGLIQTAGAGNEHILAVGDASKGVQVNADDLQVDASEIAGAGLEQTSGGGNEHLLKVKPDATGGANLAKVISVVANGVAVKIDDDTVKEVSSQLKVAYLTDADQETGNGAPSATSGDGQDSGLDITNVPAGEGIVQVVVNGLKVECGDGVKTKDCYFSVDGGTTARAFGAIASGDSLYWNGVVAGYDLATSDRLAFLYQRKAA